MCVCTRLACVRLYLPTAFLTLGFLAGSLVAALHCQLEAFVEFSTGSKPEPTKTDNTKRRLTLIWQVGRQRGEKEGERERE